MIRDTSRWSYEEILPFLPAKHQQIAKVLSESDGPMTANEIFKCHQGFTTITQANFHARLNEMRKDGTAREVGKRKCSVTGRLAYQVELTGNKPVKFEKPNLHKCKLCDGTGYITEQQARLF